MMSKETNTAATGMGDAKKGWKFTRSDFVGAVVVTYPNGHEVSFRTRDIGSVIVAKVLEDMADALAAQPAPVADRGLIDTAIGTMRMSLDMQTDSRVTLHRTRAKQVLEALESAQPAPVVGGASELLEQLRSELAGDKGWDYTEYEKGRLAEKERVISQLALLAARPGGEGEAVVWVDPYELMMVREHGGMLVATHEAEPESKRTQPLYLPAHPAQAGGEKG